MKINQTSYVRIFPLVLIIIITIVLGYWLWHLPDRNLFGPKEAEDKLRQALNLNPKSESLFQGVVTDNFLGCRVDGPCFIRLLSNNFNFEVIYSPGDSPCSNSQAINQGISLKEGDKVKVFALYEGQMTFSTCLSNEYYIKKIQ